MRAVQIYADVFEAIYNFADITTDEQIKEYWQEYEESEYSDFEEFMNETYTDVLCERFYVDSEVNV